MDDPNWRVNPQFSLRVSESAKVKITLRQRPESFSRGPNFSMRSGLC
jgi:hypothetical protein